MRTPRGYSLIELLAVLAAVGALGGVAALKYRDARTAATAAALVADARAIQSGLRGYYAAHRRWPAEAGPGQVPAGLATYLSGPVAGSFDRVDYVLDYENIAVEGEPLIGISVETTDPRLLARFVATFARRSPFVLLEGRLTYFIAGPRGIL